MRARPRRLLAFLVALGGCQPDVVAPPNPPTVSALFDPTATPPVVPTPNNLAFRGGDGTHLNIVDLPTDSPAQVEFNAYLRTLSGFPSTSTAVTAFSAPVDPASVTVGGSVLVVDATTGMALDASQVQASLTPDGTRIVIQPTQRWEVGHQFAVLVFGDNDPQGVRGAAGEIVVAAPTFFLLRSQGPLIALCIDPVNPGCACPAIEDPSCHSIVRGVDDATARAAEPERDLVNAGLTPIIAATGRDRNSVIQFWTFTVTAQPMLVYDPTRGDIPFPNDILIDPVTGLVNLPISPADPQAAQKMELNLLDGFGVSSPETANAALPAGDTIDAKTLIPNMTAFLVNLDPRPTAVQPTYAAAAAFGQTVALQPLVALASDQNKYAAVLTTLITDSTGQPILPPPTMVLLKSASPLFDGTHSTVNVLDDAQAAQLEMLRVALQPLFAALQQKGLPKQIISAAWTFTTESIVRPLLAVDAFPSQTSLSTDVTITTVVDEAALATKAPTLPYPVSDLSAVVLGTFTSKNVINRDQHRIVFDRNTMQPTPQADIFMVMPPANAPSTPIKFWMSIPKVAPPGGAPVIILQHGFTSWRGGMISLANDFAKVGFAAIAFDIDFHGARTACVSDDQCNSGGCANGVCAGGLKLQSTADNALACSLELLSGDPTDCNPVASGAAFIQPNDLFITKANGQQYVVDAAQLVRVLQSPSASGLVAQLAAEPGAYDVDSAQITFLGHSVGAIGGTLFLSVDPTPKAAVLNAGGAHNFDALASGAFAPVVDQYLASIGVMRGTPQFAQIDATARWVLDPVDPFSVARFVRRTPLTSYLTGIPNAPKPVILQTPGMDMVIPPPFQADLALALFGPSGLDAMGHVQSMQNDGTFVSTFFPDAVHATIISGQPLSEGVPMRIQAATFIATGGATLPTAQ